ncbi:biotin--[acetyl-CoA-carboxylase] ligase [Risungbinella massiliensis]|uniref:biotin--[acetyl-CoA-carboxylase] ligase n=1 Tax=Risungbinella massiliensis TaxID=1329796 RepID=UPI0005CC7387|nr:biotin--[acetyl-CoA-carboxylase] ligase [Risungbinella massiliensis]
MPSNVRTKMLEVLIQEEKGYVSGAQISRKLGVSRAAVWKQMEELRREGYEIEAKPNHGYKLRYRPDRVAPEEISPHLETKWVGRSIRYFPSVSSTQIIAHEWAKEKAPSGAFVLAEEQTSGRGRLGRAWHSPISTGIWMSGIFRPKIPLYLAPQLTLLTSVAVCEAIQEETGLSVGIKWPNDLYVEGKKICGILTELRGDQDQIDYAVIGIGINVNLTEDQIPEELLTRATSLQKELGKSIHRATLITKIWKRLENLYLIYEEKGFEVIRLLWESYANMLQKPIIANTPQGWVEGIALGLNAHGALRMQTETGVQEVYSAEIEAKT